ncbi:MAG: metallophosphoesterase [Lachnospiraceae bacterium]|nr:metallophosphoesterase [Lachnospiraceae bacterium]
MSIYAMSDIHGMYGSFIRRVKQLDDLKSVKEGKDKLILLGDYIDGGNNSFKVLKTIYDLQMEVGSDNMIVLMGNHDKWFLDFIEGKNDDWIYGHTSNAVLETFLHEPQIEELTYIINKINPGKAKMDKLTKYVVDCLMENHGDLIRWYKKLPLYYKTNTQIFVHAGVDEEAEEYWHVGTSDEMFIEKYPPTKGEFYMDIIAGHVSTSTASGDMEQHDIYYDGKSHFFIDGVDSYPNNTWDDDRIIPVLIYEKNKIKGEDIGQYYSLLEDGRKKLIVTRKLNKYAKM